MDGRDCIGEPGHPDSWESFGNAGLTMCSSYLLALLSAARFRSSFRGTVSVAFWGAAMNPGSSASRTRWSTSQIPRATAASDKPALLIGADDRSQLHSLANNCMKCRLGTRLSSQLVWNRLCRTDCSAAHRACGGALLITDLESSCKRSARPALSATVGRQQTSCASSLLHCQSWRCA